MPSVTYDGRSFMLDGRRIWLVGGELHPARIPAAHWADRIHAARALGLNCVVAPVVWARHEPRPGHFDFAGDNDIRQFVRLVQREGMHLILRPGPFVGGTYDLGGLPGWLLQNANLKPRTANGPFLEACSRFIAAIADQVRDLQITAPGAGGPIIALQNEHAWSCGHDGLANGYLAELIRFHREAGLNVPVLNANNLWQSVEGELDCWSGSRDMLATMRQLGSVRSDQPRIVIGFETAAPALWGESEPAITPPWLLQRRLAEILAGGGQFSLSPVAGGINFGFSAGRSAEHPSAFFVPWGERGTPVTASGSAGESFEAVRRISTFASRFGRVWAHLDPGYTPVVADVGSESASTTAKGGHAPLRSGVIHVRGSQGGCVFVFADEPPASGQRLSSLLLPDGSTLPVDPSRQGVVWCLLDFLVGGRSTLDYANLCALTHAGRVLVLYGPPGSRAVLSVNGSPLETVVPASGAPAILEHEGLVLVIANDEQARQIHAADEAVYIGTAGLASDTRPLPAPGVKSIVRIAADGTQTVMPAEPIKLQPAPQPMTLSGWTSSHIDEYADGSGPRFASIPGPADLTAMGSPSGYGWYRIALKASGPRKVHLRAPDAGDRVQFFADGVPVGIVGVGPGANEEVVVPVKKQTQLVALAENFGRFAGGPIIGEPKGLFGHLLECEAIKLPKPHIEQGAPVDILAFRAPLWELRTGDATLPDRVTWSVPTRKKSPMLLTIKPGKGRGLLLVNDAPIAFVSSGGPTHLHLDGEKLGKGTLNIQFAPAPDQLASAEHDAILAAAPKLELFEVTQNATSKAEWSFARWDVPPAAAFKPGPKSKTDHLPVWHRCTFEPPETRHPAALIIEGLSKGQVYLNGKHLCRYFNQTADRHAVCASIRLDLPASLLRAGEANELVLFDEHGFSPSKCRLVFDAGMPILSDPPGALKKPEPPPPPPPKKAPEPVKKKPAKKPAPKDAPKKELAKKEAAKK